MAQQHLLFAFCCLFIVGLIGTFYAEATGKDPRSVKASLYSIWPTVIGLIGFIAIALLVK